MPINFGFTQGDMEYKEMTSPEFRVYFDSRVPEEGAMAMQSLTTVKPLMEKWMGPSRDLDDPLRVVMSNVSTNASFANFIYDAIELQTPYQNIRDLAWHEYAHIFDVSTLQQYIWLAWYDPTHSFYASMVFRGTSRSVLSICRV